MCILPRMKARYDVAIVGGGIAGGALACALARGGLGVLLLERQLEYRDRVLGEGMMPWGVAEARRNGVEEILTGNPEGAVTLTNWLAFEIGADPADVERDALAYGLDGAVPGVAGMLDVRHPIACEAFAAAAQRLGADVIRGVSDVTAGFGEDPWVAWTQDGRSETARCRIVVGADGKVSTMRRLGGIGLVEEPATTVAAGMLTAGLDGAPATMGYSLHETDRHLISFPQVGARSRLYVCVPLEERGRFAGKDGVDRFLAAWASPSLPFGSAIAAGRQDGPCGTFPLNSAFVDVPVGDGLVLVGDAAGWVDPLIGQGLSMAMRDARSVAEVLLGGTDWGPAAFDDYVEERRLRLRILALNALIQQRLDVDFTPGFQPQRMEVTDAAYGDPVFGPVLRTQTRGPEIADPVALTAPERARLSTMLGVPV